MANEYAFATVAVGALLAAIHWGIVSKQCNKNTKKHYVLKMCLFPSVLSTFSLGAPLVQLFYGYEVDQSLGQLIVVWVVSSIVGGLFSLPIALFISKRKFPETKVVDLEAVQNLSDSSGSDRTKQGRSSADVEVATSRVNMEASESGGRVEQAFQRAIEVNPGNGKMKLISPINKTRRAMAWIATLSTLWNLVFFIVEGADDYWDILTFGGHHVIRLEGVPVLIALYLAWVLWPLVLFRIDPINILKRFIHLLLRG